jgi:hypothetical protein
MSDAFILKQRHLKVQGAQGGQFMGSSTLVFVGIPIKSSCKKYPEYVVHQFKQHQRIILTRVLASLVLNVIF